MQFGPLAYFIVRPCCFTHAGFYNAVVTLVKIVEIKSFILHMMHKTDRFLRNFEN